MSIPKLPQIGAIWAESADGFIGMSGKLPWEHVGVRLKGDLPRFQKITTGKGNNAVLYGKNTLFSFGNKALDGRFNGTLSQDKKFVAPEGVTRYFSYEEAMEALIEQGFDEIWICGGKRLYEEALKRGPYQANTIIKTVAFDPYVGDVKAPQYDSAMWKLQDSQAFKDLRQKVETWSRII